MRTKRIGTVLVGLALVAAACGGGADDPSSATVPATEPTTTSTTAAPTTTTEDPAAAVEQAFYDQWDAFVEIAGDPDVTNPLIDEYFTGRAKEGVLDGVSKLIAGGEAIRLPDDASRFRPTIDRTVIQSPTDAVVFECTIDGLVVYEVAPVKSSNDAVEVLGQRNDFKFIDGRWKATDLRDLAEGEPRCDRFVAAVR